MEKRILGIGGLLIIALIVLWVVGRPPTMDIELKQISSRQATVQLESESGVSALRELKVAGRAIKPDLPMDEAKVKAIARKIVRENYPVWRHRSPAVTQKEDPEMGSYWEARYEGRNEFWKITRLKAPTLIIAIHAKTRVYDVVEEKE